MSYISVEDIRHRLIDRNLVVSKIINQPVCLIGTDYIRFYGAAIQKDSLTVKSIQTENSSRTTLSMNQSPLIICSVPLVPGSVVVASDSSLGKVYTENKDYIINYNQGDIQIKEGGLLQAGMNFTIWYLPFTIYQVEADYQEDLDHAQIKRTGNGRISSGETVYIDFQPVYENYSEELLSMAVAEANALIAGEVDPERKFGADPTLIAAASSRAMEIICRLAAGRELSGGPGDDKKALSWLRLSDDYANRCEKLLKIFRPPYQGPALPAHS
jgi:hypothetical protein